MGIPDVNYYDPETKTFSEEMSINIFEQFIEMIDSTIRYVDECVSNLLDHLDDDNSDEQRLISNLNDLASKVVSWKTDTFQLELTVFTNAHECIELCKCYHHYGLRAGEEDAPDPVTPAANSRRISNFYQTYKST